ncbi:MAG: fumarylacetoacetate hydrolase family protein [Rhodobacteraceae bacterium]|nr:fumarylacetoacetate hydrolase family protein [Paracoccaceae bacterium]
MDYVIEPPVAPAVAVEGGGVFPLRRVFCVGRNYLEHVREMGNDEKAPPFFFMKPADAVVPGTAGAEVPYPPQTSDLHHEIELAVAIGRGGRRISAGDALAHVWGAGAAVDLTRRDLQGAAKAAGRPWDMGKGFDASAPIAPLRRVAQAGSLVQGRIWLAVNGTLRQEGNLAEMIWPVTDIIAFLSQSVALAPGDLILTGTPAGVGPVGPGDRITGGVDGLPELDLRIAPPV